MSQVHYIFFSAPVHNYIEWTSILTRVHTLCKRFCLIFGQTMYLTSNFVYLLCASSKLNHKNYCLCSIVYYCHYTTFIHAVIEVEFSVLSFFMLMPWAVFNSFSTYWRLDWDFPNCITASQNFDKVTITWCLVSPGFKLEIPAKAVDGFISISSNIMMN